MKNIKYIIAFVVFGFLLSFIIGMASKASLAVVFIRALCAALSFGVLSFIIIQVFDKVLNLDFDTGRVSVSSAGTDKKATPSLSKVDLFMTPEELPSETTEPRFIVGGNRQMLYDYDRKGGSTKTSLNNKAPSPPSSTPLNNNVSGNGSGNGNEGKTLPVNNNSSFTPIKLGENSSSTDIVDVLPDFNNMGGVQEKKPPITISNAPSDNFTPTPLVPPASTTIPDAKSEESVKKNDIKNSSKSNEYSNESNGGSNNFSVSIKDEDTNDSVNATAIISDDTDDDDELPSDDDYLPTTDTESNSIIKNEVSDFAKGQDVTLMARAISTLLTQDKD